MDKIIDWIEIIGSIVIAVISIIGLFLIAHPVGWLILGLGVCRIFGIL